MWCQSNRGESQNLKWASTLGLGFYCFFPLSEPHFRAGWAGGRAGGRVGG